MTDQVPETTHGPGDRLEVLGPGADEGMQTPGALSLVGPSGVVVGHGALTGPAGPNPLHAVHATPPR